MYTDTDIYANVANVVIGLVDPTVLVEPLTEERAARTLYRIELLRKIREQVRLHSSDVVDLFVFHLTFDPS